MTRKRQRTEHQTPAEVAALYLAADEARWLAEEHGISSFWETARILADALPDDIAERMDYCWAHAGVLTQECDGDRGYYRRLQCHAAFLREEHGEVYEEIVDLVARTRDAHACAASAIP